MCMRKKRKQIRAGNIGVFIPLGLRLKPTAPVKNGRQRNRSGDAIFCKQAKSPINGLHKGIKEV